MQDPSMPPMPTMPAILGLACYKCFKQGNVRLSRCSGCRRISYCSTGSSTIFAVDWKVHKAMCQALSAIETSNAVEATTLLYLLPNEPTTDVKRLDDMIGMQVENILSFLQRSLEREVSFFEITLVSYEPRCMVCTRTDQLIRMEDARKGIAAQNSRRLIPCPQCNMSFYCSQAHLDIARTLHHGPCEDAPHGHEGLSQCEMHRENDTHTEFKVAHPISRRFKWSPPREGEFNGLMRQSIPASSPVAPWIRAASDDLSMIMTILYGLEKLNGGDVEWTRKHTLTIHIIGAARPEVARAAHLVGFEEILHRLPEVKTLKLVLCGPNIPGDLAQRIFDCQVCRQCTLRGRKCIHEFAVDTYHGYAASKGSQFEKPDLCIAFNSGAAQTSQETWPATFKILVDRKIPTLFTSYTRQEAEGEAALLRASGATLHPELGPAKNPWGSLNVRAGTATVYGFQAESGWLAGGFR
ncbi:hypothetical protein C8J57DRAFT_1282125 [Mycena rebaudengoi]|nr:hypothetical protein C8J57DRAFT_1282125 [Mycena rebaudengoi]